MRQVADYKIIEPVSREMANDILTRAYRFVDAIRQYLENLQLSGFKQ